jgi:hypothetical protein
MQRLRVFASVSNMEVQRIPHQQKFVNFPIVPRCLIVIDKFRLEKADDQFSIRKQNAGIAVGEVKSLRIGSRAAYQGISECCNMGSQSAASQ